ncbi:metallophosphoesterase [Bacteriovoracaceae bacterium]|nr:metallophosphoesterase [Bacteriovoracaceae bacterium]
MKYIICSLIFLSITSVFAQNRRYCIVGDTGTGQEIQYRISKVMELRNCDEVLITGDIIYPDGISSSSDPQIETKFFKPFKNLFDKGVEMTLSMGNHDYRGNIGAWIEVASTEPLLNFPKKYFYFIKNNICFVSLDTNDHFDEQANWLQKEVYPVFKNQSCSYILAFAHHPYKSSGAHGNSKGEVKRFLKKNIIGKVDAFFGGHDHFLSYEGKKKGTRLFVSGAGAKLRWTRFWKRPPYKAKKQGFVAMDVFEDKIEYKFVVLGIGVSSKITYQVTEDL